MIQTQFAVCHARARRARLFSLAFRLALLLGLTVAASRAEAGVVTPPGLTIGSSFRLLFVTSGTTKAQSTNISTYDTFVQNAANAAGLNTYNGNAVTWQVLGSTSAVSAVSRVPTSSPALYRIDGVKVATSGADLWDGSILAPIDVTENGVTLTGTGFPAANVFTGTATNGNATNRPFGSGFGTTHIGYYDKTNGNWVNFTNPPSADMYPLYAVSQELTSVPEPSSFVLLLGGLALGCIGLCRKVRAGRQTAQ